MNDPARADGPRLAADLGKSDLLELYEYMALARAAEDRLEIMLKQGHVKGGLYRSLGQEAVGVGSAFALDRRVDGTGDMIAQTVRTTGAIFLMGGTPLQYFRQYLARSTGPTRGREANVHWCDFRKGLLGPVSPLGTMTQVMAGITLVFKQTGQPRVGLAYAGDGQTSTGAWHEGLNFAAVRRCPFVAIVQSNKYAFSTPIRLQTRLASFTGKAAGYGIESRSVDGNDVLEVFEATRDAVARARDGGGVTLIEARTYRRLGHAQHDAQEYVPREEIEEWERKDPIGRFRERMVREGWALESELDALDVAARERCEKDAERAIQEPAPDAEEAVQRVYEGLITSVPWTRLPEPTPRGAAI